MRSWTGTNVFQWEHKRRWDMANGDSEFCRADGALMVPGFTSLSVFFRRESQSLVGAFTIRIWTTPIYFQPLDEASFVNAPEQHLYELQMGPVNPISTAATGVNARVFGGAILPNQPVGSLLFWQIKNETGSAANIVGDIYVVPNHTGSMTLTSIGRTVDGPESHASLVGRSLMKDR